MEHACKSKKDSLIKYNIIDRKKYQSELVYDCCCLGVKLGKYASHKKNLQYIQGIVSD